jgi:hypothetical protein
MDLQEAGVLTDEQAAELAELQRLADLLVDFQKPVQMEGADEIVADLQARGLWAKSNQQISRM